MPGFLESLSFNEEQVTGTIDYLKGNIFQKITMTAQIRIETWISPTTDDPILFGDPTFKTDDWVTDPTGAGRFADFNVDDSIVLNGVSGGFTWSTATIQEKIDDNTIRLNQTTSPPISANDGRIELDQQPEGATFDYGLIENTEAVNFLSKVDGSLMRYEHGSSPMPTTFTSMNAVGKLDWQLGLITLDDCQIKETTSGDDLTNNRYIFQIQQTFLIHPFFRHNQILDLLIPKAPKYFLQSKALRHVFRFRAFRELQDPNVYQELLFDDKIGNTGWFDEEYNGGDAEYEVTNLAYSNSLGLTRDDTVTVTFDVENTADNTNGNAAYVCVNVIMLPEDETDYNNLNIYQYKNYAFDRAFATTGGGAVQGINNGTNNEIIKDLTVTSGSGLVAVEFDIDFGSDVKSKIDSLTNKRYLIAAYAVASGMTAEDANYVTMLVDTKEIQVNIPNATVTVTNDFYKHDENTYTGAGAGAIDMSVEEEIVGDSLILLDRAAPFDDIQIENVSVQIIATDGTEEAILQEQVFDLSQAPEISGVRFVNDVFSNSLNVASNEIRKTVSFTRETSEDTGTQVAYRVRYPFLIRWEYWENLLIGTLPADFLDTAEANNGYNHEWLRLDGLSGWSIIYRVKTEVLSLNTLKTIESDTTLTLHDYDDGGGNWDNGVITCLDGATTLDISGTPYIMDASAGRNTTIHVEFDWIGVGAMPAAADVFVVFRIIPKENGTYIANDSLSSNWNRDSVSFLTSASGLVSVSQKTATVMQADCEVDYTKLPAGVTDFTISAFIRED